MSVTAKSTTTTAHDKQKRDRRAFEDLDAAADVVTEAYELFQELEESERQLLLDARLIGEKLIKAKALCKHREWLPLLSSIFNKSTRRAQELKQIAENWDHCKNARSIAEATRMVRALNKEIIATPVAADILQAIELVLPGLSRKEVIEQSSCFAFKDGRVYTYNDEICCSAPCEYAKGAEFAVKAAPLLHLLRLGGDKIDKVNRRREELRLLGQDNRAGVRSEKNIVMPLENVEPPTKWRSLPAGFDDALTMTVPCVSTDITEFVNTCVHFHPEWTEACDNFQIHRNEFTLGLKRHTLVRGESIKPIAGHGMNEFSVTKNWLHFRNPTGLIMSCRRWKDEYPDYTPFIKQKGKPLTLKPSLIPAIKQTMIFSKENADENQVLIQLKPGELRITGRGASGWSKLTRRVEYKGPRMEFNISPSLLIDAIEAAAPSSAFRVSPGVLKLRGDGWVYVACLGVVKDEEGTEEERIEQERYLGPSKCLQLPR